MCDISRVFVVKENGEAEEKYFCVKCQTDLTGEAVEMSSVVEEGEGVEGGSWVRLCAWCRAVLEKKHLKEELRCKCGWIWKGAE